MSNPESYTNPSQDKLIKQSKEAMAARLGLPPETEETDEQQGEN